MCGHSPRILAQELAAGYMSGKLLLKLDAVNYLLQVRAEQGRRVGPGCGRGGAGWVGHQRWGGAACGVWCVQACSILAPGFL